MVKSIVPFFARMLKNYIYQPGRGGWGVGGGRGLSWYGLVVDLCSKRTQSSIKTAYIILI